MNSFSLFGREVFTGIFSFTFAIAQLCKNVLIRRIDTDYKINNENVAREKLRFIK